VLRCFDQITRVDWHVSYNGVQFPHTYLRDRKYPYIDSSGLFLPLAVGSIARGLCSFRIVLPLCVGTGLSHSNRSHVVNDGCNYKLGPFATIPKGQGDAEKPKNLPVIRSSLTNIVLNDV
jgi:hypothetical protein